MQFFTLPKLSALFTGGVFSYLLITIGVIFLIYLITAWIGKEFDVSLGPIKMKFGGGKKSNLSDKKYIVEKVRDITKKIEEQIVELRYDTLRRQVNFTQDKSADIKSILSETYSDLLKEKLPEEEKSNVKSHKEYKQYQMVLKIAMQECIVSPLKKAFKVNHLNELDGAEWDKYIEHKLDLTKGLMSEFLDVMYTDSSYVSREELSDGNNLKLLEFKEEMQEIINNAKDIQTKNDDKITELKKELETKINDIIENGDKK